MIRTAGIRPPAPQTQNPGPWTLQLTPCPLYPAPYTLHPPPCTLHPAPCTLLPTPFTLYPAPYILHPSPCNLIHNPYTLRPLPYTLHPAPYPAPYTLHLHPTPKPKPSSHRRTKSCSEETAPGRSEKKAPRVWRKAQGVKEGRSGRWSELRSRFGRRSEGCTAHRSRALGLRIWNK